MTCIVNITVVQYTDSTSCHIPLNVQLINDNIPAVDLNGPNRNGTNYTTSLRYNYKTTNSTSIVSNDATISDADVDSKIISITLNLMSYVNGDRVIGKDSLCGYQEAESGTCYIK